MITVQRSILDHQTAIIDMISTGQPLKNILHYIVRSLESSNEAQKQYSSITLYNTTSNTLEQTISNSLPQSFINAMSPIEVSPYGGSSGTAAFFQQTVLVSDIEYNPIWQMYRFTAMQHNIRACVSVPLLSSTNELLGTMELYSNQVNGISQQQIHHIETLRTLAALAIEISQNKNVQLLYSFKIDNLAKDRT